MVNELNNSSQQKRTFRVNVGTAGQFLVAALAHGDGLEIDRVAMVCEPNDPVFLPITVEVSIKGRSGGASYEELLTQRTTLSLPAPRIVQELPLVAGVAGKVVSGDESSPGEIWIKILTPYPDTSKHALLRFSCSPCDMD